MSKATKLKKNIVSVVFDFDLETLEEKAGAVQYTYFWRGDATVGDIALVNSPNGGLKGVMVVDVEPCASSVLRARKSIIGIVGMDVFWEEQKVSRKEAVKTAWEENYSAEF